MTRSGGIPTPGRPTQPRPRASPVTSQTRCRPPPAGRRPAAAVGRDRIGDRRSGRRRGRRSRRRTGVRPSPAAPSSRRLESGSRAERSIPRSAEETGIADDDRCVRRPWPRHRGRPRLRTPRPVRNPSSSALARARSRVPSGCSLPRSADAARSSSSATSMPAAATTATTSGRPSVSVPVLSKTTVSMRWAISSASPPRMRIPASAPRPVPTMIAVGVARPIAHGQATITTAMNAVSARVRRGSGPSSEPGHERDARPREDERARRAR